MLDFVGKRYGILPSQVMKLGDSIDMRVATIAVGYEAYLNNKSKSNAPDNKGYSTEQLTKMMQQVRGQESEHKNNTE